MTHTTNDAPVTVEQVDVLAAAAFLNGGNCPTAAKLYLTIQPLAAAFARHRLAALASAPAGDGVDALRALSDAATPGPWSWEQCGEKEDVPVVGIAFAGDDPDCKAPYEGEFRDGDASRMTIAYDWQSCDGHSPSSNAALAVAAVNYVRAALARPRAAVGDGQ